MAIITREILEQADKENKSLIRQIAIENGVTRQAVYQMRKKYGMTKPKNWLLSSAFVLFTSAAFSTLFPNTSGSFLN